MYTPPLSDFSVISLRRLAWTMGSTMGSAFGRIVRLMPSVVDPALVCQPCAVLCRGLGSLFSVTANYRHHKYSSPAIPQSPSQSTTTAKGGGLRGRPLKGAVS
jgi:hypothetical protein